MPLSLEQPTMNLHKTKQESQHEEASVALRLSQLLCNYIFCFLLRYPRNILAVPYMNPTTVAPRSGGTIISDYMEKFFPEYFIQGLNCGVQSTI